MSMKRCSDCGNDVSSEAIACPHCGRKLRQRTGCIAGCAAMLLVLFFAAAITSYLRTPEPQVPPPGAGGAASRPPATPWEPTPTPEPCQEHVELLSAARVAEDMGTSEEWVVANHRVNLFARPVDQGRGGKVGELLPGSRAMILQRHGGEYQVRSPLDDAVGWINGIQVARTLYQDINTREPCEP